MNAQLSHAVTVEGMLRFMGPLRVGGQGGDQESNEMSLYRLTEEDNSFTIPGSSLKGVCRSHVERMVRLMQGEACSPIAAASPSDERLWPMQADDPVDSVAMLAPCATRDDGFMCPVCQLFGSSPATQKGQKSGRYKGRKSVILFQDATATCLFEERAVTPLSHFSQQVITLLREPVVSAHTSFPICLQLRNPEPWQLALVAFLLRDMSRADLSFGAASSRGLGRATLSVHRVGVRTYCRESDGLFQSTMGDQVRSQDWDSSLFEVLGSPSDDDPIPKDMNQILEAWSRFAGEIPKRGNES